MQLPVFNRVLSAALHVRDEYTAGHCARVEWLAVALGRRCGLADDDIEVLRSVARLHDIGKIGIPDAVLLKPGRLDPDEWAVMTQHPLIGQRMCASLEHEDAERVAHAVRHHHEAWSGSGYPDGLAGEAIPVCARVIACADAYDAMTTRRVYQGARSHEQAVEILRGEGGVRLDPWILDRFLALIDEPGTREHLAGPH